MLQDGLPSFAELPVRPGAPPRSDWGLFGDDDQLGTINFLTPERVAAAAKLVKTGKHFPMNWSLLLPSPPLFGRQPLKHRLGHWPDRMVVDDVLHNFYPQVSSEVGRAAARRPHRRNGLYNGVPIEEAAQREGGPLGIDNFARRGIAGRGVLRHQRMANTGRPFSGMDSFVITRDHMIETARAEGVEFNPGDILLISHPGRVPAAQR